MNKNLMPLELDICLSNLCNMRCKYCYGEDVDRGGALRLSALKIKMAVLQYLKHIRPAGIVKISLSGGEPLLDKKLLVQVIPWLRATVGERTPLACFTNGVLLEQETADLMQRYNVHLKISLDGEAASHDLNRVTNDGRPTFRRVMENIRALKPETRRRLLLYPTITRRTVKHLSSNIRFLCALGTDAVRPSFAIQEVWNAKDISILRRELIKTREYFRMNGDRASSAMPRFGYQHLRPGRRRMEDFCLQGELSVGPDGAFYPCGDISASMVPQSPRLKARYSLGDVCSGVSMPKLARSRHTAFHKIISARRSDFLIEPLYIYYKSLINPAGLETLLASSARIARVLLEEDMGEYFPVKG